MPPTTSVRVLLCEPGRPVSRAAIDWIADRQSHARVILPPALLASDALPARGRHEPFASPDPESARISREAADRLADPGSAVHAAAEATALALLEGAAVIVPDRSVFPSLIPLSCWSMNLPERPTDGLLVQHIGIAGRLPMDWTESADAALTAVRSGDAALLRRVVRARRLAARREGPRHFARLAKKSAGLRPAVVYLDLLASDAASSPGFQEWLRGLRADRARDLVSVAGAIFI